MSAIVERGRYQGVIQILRYNARLYLLAALAAGLALAALATRPPPPWLALPLGAFSVAVVMGSAVSLAVSHYVYDRSPLFRWDWLRERIRPAVARWALVHAGLDEASPALRRLYPQAIGDVLDVYDPRAMSEPAIAIARRTTTPPEPARAASGDALPLADDSCDLVLLFFAAHEFRRAPDREALFRELRRVVRPAGHVVLVEHPRDLPNLLAFGPGAFHFLPRAEWLRLAGISGLAVREECTITPFVRAFFLEPS